MITTSSVGEAERLTRNRCRWIVLSGLGLGLSLALAFTLLHIWLAPPYLLYSFLLYPALTLLWAPAVLICLAWRPVRDSKTVLQVTGAGIVVTLIFLALAGPARAGLAPNIDQTCQTETLPNHQARYTCVNDTFIAKGTYVFVGLRDWPLVRLVDANSVSKLPEEP